MSDHLSEVRAGGQIQREARMPASVAAHIQSVTNKVIKIYGFIDIDGTGEALLDIEFAVLFLELPSFAPGWHLAEGQVVVQGSYPTCEIGVRNFTWIEDDNRLRYYTGATLAIVTTGAAGQKFVGHYQFEGRAIVPPVTVHTLAEDTV